MTGEAILPVLTLLGAGILGVGLARAARMSPLIGFFISGAIVGPHALGLIQESETVHFLAEAGIAFFLFEVGLHLPLGRFLTSWKELFVLGPLQVLFCAAGLVVVTRLIGLDWSTAALVAVVLSLSSTAVVLRLLQDHGELTTPVGQRIISILVFQDIVAVVLLALIAAFGKAEGGVGGVLVTLGFLVIGLIAVVGLGRWLLQPFLSWVVRLDAGEVVTGAALFAVLSLAWLGSRAGLSIPLGAFLAGVCLAESRYGYLVQAEIAPFRMLLLSLFFLTVGLSLDPVFLASHLPMLLAITMGLLVTKSLLTALSQRVSGIPLGPAVRSGAVLSQGSEFAFIILAAALGTGMISTHIVQVVTTSVTLSLALTPLAGWAGCVLSRECARQGADAEETEHDEGEVVIVEFDEVAWEVATILKRAEVRYRGHDRDWPRILMARSRGFDVHFSDPDRPRTLSRAAAGMVKAVVILVETPDIIDRLVNGLRGVDNSLPILAATRNLSLFERLNQYALTAVFIKNEETPRLLAKALLERLHLSREAIDQALALPVEAQAARAA